jgi:hypothetical protein
MRQHGNQSSAFDVVERTAASYGSMNQLDAARDRIGGIV